MTFLIPQHSNDYFKVYYPVRHHLVQHMVSSIQRLGFSPTATLEHRKLAVELAEVIIKWEIYGIKEETETVEVGSILNQLIRCFIARIIHIFIFSFCSKLTFTLW